MKEYKVMAKSVKTGEWFRVSTNFSLKSKAVNFGKLFMTNERKRDIARYSDYKIMAREVTPWEDI